MVFAEATIVIIEFGYAFFIFLIKNKDNKKSPTLSVLNIKKFIINFILIHLNS